LEDVVHLLAEPAELVAVHHRQLLEHVPSGVGKPHLLATVVEWVRSAANEPRRFGSVDELDDGVMFELERGGQIADDGGFIAVTSPERQEELVLCGRDAGVARRLFREPLEHAQRMTEAGERLVLTI
jgi:hypothetical protein